MRDAQEIKVWDIAVRVFHWSLVAGFVIAYLSGEDEDSMLHIYAGYVVCGLILFRILWGFIGTKYARFRDFIHGPAITRAYLKSLLSRKPAHYLGHNPAGGWMVILLLISLFVVSWSGLEAYAAEGKGPLASVDISIINAAFAHGDGDGHDDDRGELEGDDFWEEIHEATVNFSLFLVAVHILGVIVSSVLHRENLVRAMITGNKHKADL
jgi:cytochrome b